MTIDLSPIVEALSFDTIEVDSSTGEYDAETGLWEQGEVETNTIQASVQPTEGSTTTDLAEGDRVGEVITIFAKAALVVADVRAGRMADVVTWGGEKYTVIGVQNWAAYGFCRATAVKAGA